MILSDIRAEKGLGHKVNYFNVLNHFSFPSITGYHPTFEGFKSNRFHP
jgi:hypothetical protein